MEDKWQRPQYGEGGYYDDDINMWTSAVVLARGEWFINGVTVL